MYYAAGQHCILPTIGQTKYKYNTNLGDQRFLVKLDEKTSLNLVITKFGEHQIRHQKWWQFCHQFHHQLYHLIWWAPNSVMNLSPNLVNTKFGDKFSDKFVTLFGDHQICHRICHRICHQICHQTTLDSYMHKRPSKNSLNASLKSHHLPCTQSHKAKLKYKRYILSFLHWGTGTWYWVQWQAGRQKRHCSRTDVQWRSFLQGIHTQLETVSWSWYMTASQ